MSTRFDNEAILPRRHWYRPSGLELLGLAIATILLIAILRAFYAPMWAFGMVVPLVQLAFLSYGIYRIGSRR